MGSTESALAEFFSECDEILQRFSSTLSVAEKDGSADIDTIGSLYRDMHTLKGSAQLFGFKLIAQVAHAMEASLEPIRRLKLQIPVQLIDALFNSIDLIERIVRESSSEQKEAGDRFDEEVKRVVPLLLSAASEHFGGELTPTSDKLSDLQEDRILANNPKTITLNVDINSKHLVQDVVHPVLLESRQSPDAPALGSPKVGQTLSSDKKTMSQTVFNSIEQVTKDPQRESTESSEANSTVRINVGLLDKLMNLVGEMVLVRNQMLQYGQKHDALEFLNLSQRLDIITSELQGDVMKTRMQPIGSILSKFQRLIRDLSKDLGKQIELVLLGTETELDKTLLEAIKDPLTHIIRNSCDHGLETTEERLNAGKPAVGHVQVRAFHEGGHVIIEVSDDGRGLNLKRILEKALEKKIMTPEQGAKLTKLEVCHLIFAPGFSTAENVTSVSGRGVGMDVVKTNIEKIGGHVELHNDEGRGMTVRLRIPLTLAIVPALIVRAGGEQFSIPQVKLAELVRVEKEGPGPKIEMLQGKPVFRLRGDLLSLVDLREVLELDKEAAHESRAIKSESVNIAVLNGDGEAFGLIVDEIRDVADIVVKPLTNFLKTLQVYSGATIMGDGSVSLILDVTGLAQKSHLFQKAIRRDFAADSSLGAKALQINQDVQDFLFFKLSSPETYCIPLCLVHRLEEFNGSEVQRSGTQRMVKYRQSILPIISLNDFFGLSNAPGSASNKVEQDSSKAGHVSEAISVIVVQRKARLFGVQVSEVVDIMSVTGSIEDSVKETNGILGSIIVGKDVATVVDVFEVLDTVAGASESKSSAQAGSKAANRADAVKNSHILFAEDTVFFMKQVRKILEASGYTVTHAADGEQAWQMLSSSKPGDYQLVLSDIEMPKMTGFELAAKIRADSRFEKTPLIALTTKVRDVDLEKGREVGFTRYLEKLRSDELLEALREILGGRASG